MARAKWIVASVDDGAPIERIAEHLRAPQAVAEGRVFIDGRRATPGERVQTGAVVELWAARVKSSADAVEILARDGEVLFAAKPAELATEPERRGGDALVGRLAVALGCPQVHAASRLDVGVSGVVACATGPQGTARLARAKQRGELRRVYLAIAGARLEGQGVWETPVDGKPATTRWAARASTARATWLELELVTGRTHQIRVHAAGAGAPLLGDRSHGGVRRLAAASGAMVEVRRPMLHGAAAALFEGGVAPALEAILPSPEDLRATWLALDGDAAAWEGWLPPWRRNG